MSTSFWEEGVGERRIVCPFSLRRRGWESDDDEVDAIERQGWVPTEVTVRAEGWVELMERRKVERRRVDLSRSDKWIA